MSLPRRALLFAFCILLVGVTRLPLFPSHLVSSESVNLALALEHFDPTLEQPQPPGFPLVVLEARLLDLFIGNAEWTFAALGLLICGLAVGILYLAGREIVSPRTGMVAAALLFVNPLFWYSSLTSPLRPHLALVSVAVAYFCWRAKRGERRPLYAASIALGVGGGAQPELLFLLLPLWAWAAWETRERKAVVRSLLLLSCAVLVWTGVLAYVSGGPRVIAYFAEYFAGEGRTTSGVLDGSTSWLGPAGRAVIWTGLGAVLWVWALPFAWKARLAISDWVRGASFLFLWFAPGFLYLLAIRGSDPDHALSVIPPLCLLGGFCLVEADRRLTQRWIPRFQQRGVLAWLAMAGNLALFFAPAPLPQRAPGSESRGWHSLSDAVLFGMYESSYARVRQMEQTTDRTLTAVAELRASTERPALLFWARDGEPSWRAISYYLPQENLYVLREVGDPGVSAAEARYYSGSHMVTRYTGPPPFRLSVPQEGRLIWVAGPSALGSLRRGFALERFSTLHYVDLPADAASISWGSFELVPE